MMELKEQIVALCNKSGLTIEEVVFVLKDAYRDAEDSYIKFRAAKHFKKENPPEQKE